VRGLVLTTHFHLVPRLKMSGAVPLLPLYAFMACAGTAFSFTLSKRHEGQSIKYCRLLLSVNNFE
jgi:hypothetical protein